MRKRKIRGESEVIKNYKQFVAELLAMGDIITNSHACGVQK